MKAIIVDDERNARENLQNKLVQIPQITDAMLFGDALEAVVHAKNHPVDIVFLDIEMPGITGIEMAKQLKDVNPFLNIIFVTGHSKYALDAFSLNASNYILKPAKVEMIKAALDNLRYPTIASVARVRVQTFGSFEIFVDEQPLHISRAKVKELLALLVDRRGVSVTTAQAAAVLWEDKEYTRSLQKQMQTVISQMMRVLRDAGIAEIVTKDWNNISVNISKFDCDYYQFLKGSLDAINAYAGEYMSEYDWAEMTADMLFYRE